MPPVLEGEKHTLVFSPQQLYPKQRQAFLGGGPNVRFRYIEASSGSGKTWGASLLCAGYTVNLQRHETVCWLGPIYEQSKIGFDMLLSIIPEDYLTFMERTNSISGSAGRMRISFGRLCRELGFPGMGGTIEYRSADKPNALYGKKYRAAFADEASRCMGESIMATESTLNKDGLANPMWMWGNVKGRNNYFYRNCRIAHREMLTLPLEEQRSFYASMTYRDALASYQRNPDGTFRLNQRGERIPVQAPEVIEDARRRWTEEEFEELYENRPMSDASRPFPDDDIDACARTCWCGEWDDPYRLCPNCHGLSRKPPVAAGWDVARHVDFNAIGLLDEDGALCGFKHFKENNWYKILHTAMEFIPYGVPFMLDTSGKGDCLPDMIKEHYPERLPFTYKGNYNVMTANRLQKNLVRAVQNREISFPVGLITDELASIETVATPSGVKYEAPDGMFDDCVDMLQLATWVFDFNHTSEDALYMSSKDRSRTRTGWNSPQQQLILGTGPGTTVRTRPDRPMRTGWQ